MNLFGEIPEILPQELTGVLCRAPNVRIERIVSHGHASPPGSWYDQDDAVLKGQARLAFEDDPEPLEMGPGDYVLIEPHRRHRVEWTAPHEPTIWLAVFYV